jgi:hypothetical protein
MAARPEELPHRTGKRMLVKIKRTLGTEGNPGGAEARANRVDSPAQATAVQAAEIVRHREAVEIAVVVEADHPAPVIEAAL